MRPVGNPAGEAVASAHPVLDLQVLELPRLMEFPFVPENRAPIIDKPALHFAQRRA